MSEHTLTVLLVPDCPHAARALDLAQRALAAVGLNATIEKLEIDDQGQADRLRFVGSPSFHLDGDDLFPTTSPPAIACRFYPTAIGLKGTPDLRDLTDAVARTRNANSLAGAAQAGSAAARNPGGDGAPRLLGKAIRIRPR